MRNFVMEYLVIPVITVFECIKGFFIGIKLGVLWGFGKISEEEVHERIHNFIYGGEE